MAPVCCCFPVLSGMRPAGVKRTGCEHGTPRLQRSLRALTLSRQPASPHQNHKSIASLIRGGFSRMIRLSWRVRYPIGYQIFRMSRIFHDFFRAWHFTERWRTEHHTTIMPFDPGSGRRARPPPAKGVVLAAPNGRPCPRRRRPSPRAGQPVVAWSRGSNKGS